MDSNNREKQWILRESGNPIYTRELVQDLGIDEVLANLLVQRGIKNQDKAREFFSPNLNMLHDPFLMKDMDKAVDRIHKAIRTNEKILIYGD
ncbi:MAG: single-stranded-DNA-specific exonuclease RecJ, partial [Bacteroidales bacterium]|nr:single-stranded-DNA-specific exonuclease RecJ [Bacteroidales bacterium]